MFKASIWNEYQQFAKYVNKWKYIYFYLRTSNKYYNDESYILLFLIFSSHILSPYYLLRVYAQEKINM